MLINSLAKSSRSSRITLSAVIVGVVTVAAYNWLVSPHTKYLYAVHQYQVLAGEMTKKNQVIQAQQAHRQKELEQLQTEFDKVKTALFTPVEAKRFFGDIEAACKETDCVVYSINFLPASRPPLMPNPKIAPAPFDRYFFAFLFSGLEGKPG